MGHSEVGGDEEMSHMPGLKAARLSFRIQGPEGPCSLRWGRERMWKETMEIKSGWTARGWELLGSVLSPMKQSTLHGWETPRFVADRRMDPPVVAQGLKPY
jgi:hypothetical protein